MLENWNIYQKKKYVNLYLSNQIIIKLYIFCQKECLLRHVFNDFEEFYALQNLFGASDKFYMSHYFLYSKMQYILCHVGCTWHHILYNKIKQFEKNSILKQVVVC
jgi:hypothetical protein